MAQTQSKTHSEVFASNTLAAIVAAGNTTALEIDVRGIDQLWVELVLTTQALDAFTVQAKPHPDSTYVSILTGITSTPAGLVVAASGTLASLAAANTGWCVLNVTGLSSLKFLVSAAVDGANLTIRAAGSAAGAH